MQYAILIYVNEGDYGKGDDSMPAYVAYTQALKEGKLPPAAYAERVAFSSPEAS